ncbi:EAL domain-containing protein [Roseiconus nitratireducens]|uniref:EAL domain-containing protein n=1 Tax=Roseiconus nitratireducens TaxID=2605748 RepID=A0A5M6D9E7_9BACT|nr:EAL domain-containing protein [Roseiconus nitratireducens]KAA5542559.1 EAL domain-containing protein [Roseiconus nitratireducens]
MLEFDSERRVLIVDDQPQIHETFSRIFQADQRNRSDLDAFEARFLLDDPRQPDVKLQAEPRFLLTHVYSGEEGVHRVETAMAEEAPFALAFVDMRMPKGMDGLETVERLWKVDPNLHVVICTAFSDHTWDTVLGRLGYNDRLLLLRKPFSQDEARQMALALTEKSRLAARQREKVSLLKSEVDRRRKAETELRDMAHRDALTSLPNRPFLLQRLERLLAGQGQQRQSHDAILFLDLDNFKIINDSLGHDAGDELLNQVAERLKECVREKDTATRCQQPQLPAESHGKTVRLGGDEFVVLLQRLDRPDDAVTVARRIVERVSEPFHLGDRMVTVGTSIGIAFIDDSIRDAHDALRNADTAMYQAKNTGKGQIAVFDQTMHDAVVARHELEAQLRSALKAEKFELRYQPIVNLQAGTIIGVEVLTRWRGDDGQYIPPDEFVPLAEEIGLINHFTEWVLERSMREFNAMMSSLDDVQRPHAYLGVNISRRQLGDPFFADRLRAIVERTKFRWSLKLEMAEHSDSRHNERSLKTMLDLHQSGIGIHIDDFGKGNSSLTCFQASPFETVKIDRTFTASIANDHSHAVIAQAIVQLAHHLMTNIVCQGVESPEQLKLLQQWGCDMGQGYFFAPPLDIHRLRKLLIEPTQSAGIRTLRKLAVLPDVYPNASLGNVIDLEP